MNNDKTQEVEIGASMSVRWEGKYGSKWAISFEILGFFYNNDKMGETSKLLK